MKIKKLIITFVFIIFFAHPAGSAEKPYCSSELLPFYIKGSSKSSLNKSFHIDVELKDVKGLVSAPFYLNYDTGRVDFIKAEKGEFMSRDGRQAVFITSDDKKAGRIVVGISRLGDRKGIDGSGLIMRAFFKAKKRGQAIFSLDNAKLVVANGVSPAVRTCKHLIEIE